MLLIVAESLQRCARVKNFFGARGFGSWTVIAQYLFAAQQLTLMRAEKLGCCTEEAVLLLCFAGQCFTWFESGVSNYDSFIAANTMTIGKPCWVPSDCYVRKRLQNSVGLM